MTDDADRRRRFASAVLNLIDEAEAMSEIADAHRPHVCIAHDYSGIGPVLGPFEDLYEATAAAAGWREQLNEAVSADDPRPIEVTVSPIFGPEE